MLIEQHNVVTCFQCGKQGTAFGGFLLRLAHVAGALHVANVLDVKSHIVLQSLHIFIDALTDESDLGLTHHSESNFHKPNRFD